MSSQQLSIPQALQIALQHHQAGRLEQAERVYREVLRHAPQHPDALHLLGVLGSQIGKHQAAAELIQRAIDVNPSAPEFHNNLGEALRRNGETERAVDCYRKALALRPDYTDALSNLGIALAKLGKAQEGLATLRTALERDPQNVEVRYNIGIVLLKLDQVDEAAAVLRQTIQMAPEYPEAHNGLGDALCLMGRVDEAVQAYEKSIRLKGGPSGDTLHNLADALLKKGRLEEAVTALRKIRELRPELPDVHNNLGMLLQWQGRFDEAQAEYEEAIKAGVSPEAHNNLANYFSSQSQLDRSIEEFHKALKINPNFYEAWSNLANALVETGRMEEALEAYTKALRIKPSFAGARSNMLLATLYHPAYDARRVLEEHCKWDEVHGKWLAEKAKPHENDRSPTRRLRIGYVSPDFRSHAVAFFSLPVLQAHDPEQFEVFCYSTSLSTDGITQRFQKRADAWHNIVGLPDDEAADLIRSHQIDILVDLAGHTGSNRMPVIAMRPAPVQINAWGYPSTTGLTSIDWRVSDRYCDPPGVAEQFNSEKLLRMPDCFWVFQPPDVCPEMAPLPLKRNGRVTFGSFNNLAKVTPQILALWADILTRVPESQLIIKSSGNNSEYARRSLHSTFARHGVPAERVRLMGKSGFQEYLALFNEVDIVLDTSPFGGGTTTCHSLWMGVPVIGLSGDRHASRMGLSILSCVGLADWVATTPEEYVRLAVEKSQNVENLAELRRTMRDRLNASPLLDAKKFTAALEHAYRSIWTDWCRQARP